MPADRPKRILVSSRLRMPPRPPLPTVVHIRRHGAFANAYHIVYSGTFYIDASWSTFPNLFDLSFLTAAGRRNDGQVNRAPTIKTPLGNANFSEGSAQPFIVPFATFADPDFNPLSITVRMDNGAALPSW